MATFWKNASQEPKRAYRWFIGFETLGSLTEGSGLQYACKRVDRPSLSVSETEHTYINHKFYYPGRVEWNEISVSFVDVVGADGAGDVFLKMLVDAGYNIPSSDEGDKAQMHTLGKESLHKQLGDVYIYMVNANGDVHEQWTLKNAFFKSVRLSGLDYGSDEMLTVDTSIRYDWAEYQRGGSNGATGGGHAGDDLSELAGQTLFAPGASDPVADDGNGG